MSEVDQAETTTNTVEDTIDFFAKLIASSVDPTTPPADIRKHASELAESFHMVAHAFLAWSNLPDTPCPNQLIQTFDAVKKDGSVDGRVEIVLRRVRPGTPSFEELLKEHGTYAAELLALRFRLDRIASIADGGCTGVLLRARPEDLDEIKRQTHANLRESFFVAATNRKRIEEVLERAVNGGVGAESLDLHHRVLEVARKREHDAKAALDAWMSVLNEATDGAG